LEERSMRGRNVILFHAADGGAKNTDEEEIADAKMVENLCKELLIIDKPLVTTRLHPGKDKPTKNPLPLKVEFQSPDTVTQILKRAKNLATSKTPEMKALSITPDRTPLQRNLRKNLREEAKERNDSENNPTMIWVVTYKNRLIKVMKRQDRTQEQIS
jgi:hypothetical protein